MTDIVDPFDSKATPTAAAGQQKPAPNSPPTASPPSPSVDRDYMGQPTTRGEAGALSDFGAGVMDEPIGAAQLLFHLAPEPVAKGIMDAKRWFHNTTGLGSEVPEGAGADYYDQLVAKRREKITADREAKGDSPFSWWETAGEIASPINYMPGLGLAGKAGSIPKVGAVIDAMLAGGGTGALNPVENAGDGKGFWGQKGTQAGAGAATGGVASLIPKLLSGVVAPTVSGAGKMLQQGGVQMTPGQLAKTGMGPIGWGFRRLEEGAESIPFLGRFIAKAEDATIHDFDRSTVNQMLHEVGAKAVPKEMEAGHKLIEHANEVLDDTYEAILPNLSFQANNAFATGIKSVMQDVGELSGDQQKMFSTIMRNRFFDRLKANGSMDGKTMKEVVSQLRVKANDLKKSSDGHFRELGEKVDDVRQLIRGVMEAQNPQYAEKLRAADLAYAMMSRIKEAAMRRPDSMGVFTPKDLLGSLASNAKRTGSTRSFLEGNALLQKFAEAGQQILPSDLRNSGTMDRFLGAKMLRKAAEGGGAAAAGTAALMNPATIVPMAKLAAAGGLASLPYTKPGMKAVNAYANPGAARSAVGAGLKQAAPAAARAGGAVGGNAATAPPKRKPRAIIDPTTGKVMILNPAGGQ